MSLGRVNCSGMRLVFCPPLDNASKAFVVAVKSRTVLGVEHVLRREPDGLVRLD